MAKELPALSEAVFSQVQKVAQLEKVQKKELKATYAILTPEDYHKLLEESSRPQKRKVNLMIRAFGQTGIRVSELQFITVESIQQQEITIRNKNKNRKYYGLYNCIFRNKAL